MVPAVARVDVLLTTRLHGMVLALNNGVPPIAIDPEPGGAKLRRQAELIGWPACFAADQIDDQALQEAFQYCLTDPSRAKAQQCREHAQELLCNMRETFVAELQDGGTVEKMYRARLAGPQHSHRAPSSGACDSATGFRTSWWRKLKRSWNKVRRRNGHS